MPDKIGDISQYQDANGDLYGYADLAARGGLESVTGRYNRSAEEQRLWQLIDSGDIIPLDEYEITEYTRAYSGTNKEVRVDTGLYLGPTMRVELDAAFGYNGAGLSAANYMGREGVNGAAVRCSIGIAQGSEETPKFYFGFGNENLFLGTPDSDRHLFWMDVPALKYGIDGASYDKTAFTYGSVYTDYSLWIYGIYNQASVDAISTVYCERFYDNGSLAAYFVPVKRRSDGKAGFYDAIRKGFYTNTGRGTLIAGPARRKQDDVFAVNVSKTEKTDAFNALMNSSQPVDAYLFFTDPHIYNRYVTEEVQQALFLALQRAQGSTASRAVICGGDVLVGGSGDIIPGGPDIPQACGQLGYFTGVMNELFPDYYYPIFGNHDGNYKQTAMSLQSVINLMFPKQGRAYYDFKIGGTRYYVFDTGIDTGITDRTNYRKTQLNWFVEKLLENTDDAHIVICGHIFTVDGNTATDDTKITILMKDALATAAAFNARNAAFSLPWAESTTKDFSGATGTIHYCIAGHAHNDLFGEYAGIPVLINTRALHDNAEPTFDLVAYVQETDTLHTVRIGYGANRIMHCDQVTVTTTEELTSSLSGELTWASLDETVATVSDGTVTAVSTGYAVITATNEDGEAEAWIIAV